MRLRGMRGGEDLSFERRCNLCYILTGKVLKFRVILFDHFPLSLGNPYNLFHAFPV